MNKFFQNEKRFKQMEFILEYMPRFEINEV